MIHRHPFFGLVAWLAFISASTPIDSHAAVIIDAEGKELSVWIVSEDGDKVVVDQVTASGALLRRELKRSEISNIIHAISPERLEELDPSKPLGYKQYAEELAEIELDPEARPMSMRLYHIAAYLDPEGIGESCLLGMIRITSDAQLRRRLQFAAYVHSKQPNKQVFNSDAASSPSPVLSASAADLKLLRALRSRRTKVVTNETIEVVRRWLPSYAAEKTDDELKELLSQKCEHCESGFHRCVQCSGKGTVRINDQTRPCRHCTKGKVPCEFCGTFYQSLPLPNDLVQQMVKVELELFRRESKSAGSAMGEPATNPNWSDFIKKSPANVPAPISLRTLTDHDPTESIFRDGKWSKP